MVKEYTLFAPDSSGVNGHKNWTGKIDLATFGYWESLWDPTDLPDGRFGVAYVHSWNPLPIPWPGGGTTKFYYEFTASDHMMLTGWRCLARQDWYIYIAGSGARLYVFVDSGAGFRAKRALDPNHPSQDHISLDLGASGGAWVSNNITFLHPLFIPKNARVRFELHLGVASGDLPFSGASARVGDCHIFYRSKANLDLSFSARSWISGKKILPEDAMIVSLRAIDSEDNTDISGYPVTGFHGPTSPPLQGMGKIITASMTAFPSFFVSNPAALEWTHYLQFTSGGYEDSEPHDDYLGIRGAPYVDDIATDDDGYRNSFTISPVTDEFYARKRVLTVRLFSDSFPAKLYVGDILNIRGVIEDSQQPELKDFLSGIQCVLQKYNMRVDSDWVNCTSRVADSNGNYNVPWAVLEGGLEYYWRVQTISTTQYNISSGYDRPLHSVWELVSTIIDIILEHGPPYFLGDKFDIVALLTKSDGTPLAGLPVEISFRTVFTGNTQLDGRFKITRLLDLLGSFSAQCAFLGKTVDYQEFRQSTSSIRTIDVETYRLPSRFTVFRFERPDIYAGEKAHFQATLLDGLGNPIINQPVKLQRLSGESWIDIFTINTDSAGNINPEWDPNSLLGGTDTLAIRCRAHFDGYTDTDKEPWITYDPSNSDEAILTITRLKLNTSFSRFSLDRTEIIKGELAVFRATLQDQQALGVGPISVKLQREDAGEWKDIKLLNLDQNGNGIMTWDPSALLGTQSAVTIKTRLLFDGYENKNVVPWKKYNPCSSNPINLVVYALPPDLGHLMLRCKIDNKYYEEIPSKKSVLFKVDPPDYYNNKLFDRPQTVLVNPGTYIITCTVILGEVQLSDTDSRNVLAGQDVLMEFNFFTEVGEEGQGRINISINSSKNFIVSGESVEISGTVTLPLRIRSVPMRKMRLKIFANEKIVSQIRTNLQGQYLAEIILHKSGENSIYAQISGPLGNFSVAKSPTIKIMVT